MSDDDPPVLPPQARERLLAIARSTLESYLASGRAPPPDTGGLPELLRPGAAFVTLRRRDGELRGCIGVTRAEQPLGETVRELAISAATRDRRFEPVEAAELPDIHIDVSVLSPLAPANLDAIVIGRHGLVVRRGYASGLLLPQVASEQGWDKEEFLDHTCRKAGLPEGAWRDPGTQVFWFTCDLAEEDPPLP